MATTSEEVTEIIRDSFVSKLQNMLQLESSGASASIVDKGADELGVDSLVAVEVRSWFMKELQVDMPVLKILGGAVVGELIEFGIEKLPEKLTPNLGKGGEKAPAAAAPVKQAPPPRNMPATTANAVADEVEGQAPVATLEIVDTELRSPTPTAAASESSQPSINEDTPPSSEENFPLSKSEMSELETPQVEEAIPEPPQEEPEPDLPPLVFSRTLPMAPGQSRFWFLRHYLQDQTTFNIAVSIRIKGALRVDDLAAAVKAVGQRHEGLRTAFFVDDDGEEQGILATSSMELEKMSIDTDEVVMDEFHKMRDYIFDIERGETMRMKLLTQTPTDNFLIIGYNHINMDGVSFEVLLQDLEKAYSRKPFSKSLVQFPDFAVKQEKEIAGGGMDSELDYWRGEFPDLPPPLPLMSLSKAGSRRALSRYASNRIDVHIDAELSSKIREVCKKQKATPFHFYLAAFRAMLFRFLEVDDVCIGIADAARADTSVSETIGMFLNLLPLRFKAKRLQTFSDALKEAKTKAYAAFANSKVPFGVLLEQLDVPRSSLYNPLFQAFVDYRQGVDEKRPFGNVQLEGQTYEVGRTAYDLNLDIIDNPKGDGHIMFMVQESLYSTEDAEIMMKSYVNLLEAFAKNPAVRLTRPDLFAKKDVDAAIKLGQGPTINSTWPTTIPHRIDQIITEFPDKIAVKDNFGNALTYKQLDARANNIATALLDAKIENGSRVGVFQEPSADWPCSLIAIMRVGAVYVPLDPRMGVPRLSTVVKASEPSAIICHALTADDVSGLNTAATVISLDFLPRASTKIATRAQPDSPAVTLYTSGSTGVPKGIIIKHYSLLNELEMSSIQYDTKEPTVLQQCPLSFDLSLEQMLIALTNGGTVFMVSQDRRADPAELCKIIAEEGITYTVATPSEYLMWLRYGNQDIVRSSGWVHAYAGGEQLPETLKQAFRTLGKADLNLYNLYGPSEITIACHKGPVEYMTEGPISRIAAGFPLPNVSTYILDEKLKPCPVGMPGEIVIGGAGVAVGYSNNQELSKEKFVLDPFAIPAYTKKGWSSMHRTGDRGRMQKDGQLLCEGRITGDTQIKLRGQRIELQDIESTIVNSSNGVVVDAVVSVRGDSSNEYLVAHVVLSTPGEDKEDFLEKLRTTLALPPYMIPARILTLDKMPFNSHQKRDRLAIGKLPLAETSSKPKSDTKLTATEAQLKLVWEKVLSNDAATTFNIESDTEFFFVGGNSMLLVRLQAIIREEFDVVMPLVTLFETSTLGSMAAGIENIAPDGKIDWLLETAVPAELEWLEDTEYKPAPWGRTVLLTGCTGYLGRSLLRRLVADPTVSKIHCVAIRQHGSEPRKLTIESEKIVAHAGNLAEPLLGLTQEVFAQLASEVDVILHNGAQRSFWEYYQLLRGPNVKSTKELIKLASPRKIPVHYLSSGGCLHLGSKAPSSTPGSVASTHPPTDGSNGYVASKWASEIVLENAAAELEIPVRIHRFIPAGDDVLDSDNSEILAEFVHFTLLTKILPTTAGWDGTFDLVPAADVADDICTAAVGDDKRAYVHHAATIKLDATATSKFIEESPLVKEAGGDEFTVISALDWVGRIKVLGFKYMFASQDLVLETGDLEQNDNKVLASRR